MKSSAILREAARLVERYSDTLDHLSFPAYGCYAIRAAIIGIDSSWYLADEDDSVIAKPMKHYSLMRPESTDAITGRMGWFDDDSNARIIGLCLAASIAESEGD